MRSALALPIALVVTVASRAGGQCSPAVQKLTNDLKYDDARAATQALVSKSASDDAALDCVGRIYLAEGKSADAVEWFEKAVKINDRNASHHLDLGNALGNQAEKASVLRQPFLAKRCKREFERAIALDSTLVGAREGLQQFYLMAPGFMGGSIDKAREQARAIARFDPLRGHYAMARLMQHEHDGVGAERELRAALAGAPDSLDAWYRLGFFYIEHKKWPDAFSLYDRMITEKPGEAMSHYQYGRVAALSGENMERGERELRLWLTNAPADAPIGVKSGAHLRLGMIAARQGKKDDARSEYQLALSINPRNTEAKKLLEALR